MISLDKKKKLESLLGLARRAGQLESGMRNVEKGIKEGWIQVVVIAEDAADNVKKNMTYLQGEGHAVVVFYALDKSSLGEATGQSDKAVLGLPHGKLAEAVIAALRA